MNTKEIIHNLIHYEKIADVLSDRKWIHFKWYSFIAEGYLKKNFNNDFKRRFCWFYAFRGMTQSEKEIFFEFLSSNREADLETILKELSECKQKVFFSFVTKLLHTRNNKLPIYDVFVANILNLPKLKGDSVDEKINNRKEVYKKLLQNFQELFGTPQIKSCLKHIREELIDKARRENFHWRDELISEEKLLDSSLWVLHKVNKGQNYKRP